MKENGLLLSYDEFLNKFGIPITLKEYADVFDAVPESGQQMVRNSLYDNRQPAEEGSSIFFGDLDILNKKCSNKQIWNVIVGNCIPSMQCFWSTIYGNINWKKAWLSDKYCIMIKCK